ncbi:hypothetical protein SLEP1_g21082 [Rubroshorea leprosula]|uniref:Uncharacterized protein n=1 Tax=Rubroshorea leprosula TaxID=152421 RepID=A0AAV5J4T8_9ROSI|nr:hypothetical protein SLEP1_g21082 [Rubroshorea leprosula]
MFLLINFESLGVADDLVDDTSSQSSSHSGTYSNLSYLCGDDHKPEASAARRNAHRSTTRFYLEECLNIARNYCYYDQRKALHGTSSKIRRHGEPKISEEPFIGRCVEPITTPIISGRGEKKMVV